MGGLAGVAAGFFGGWTDRLVSRLADTIMAFPLFVLAMGIVAALGNTVTNIVIATAIINFPLYVRVARAEANVRRDAGFVLAALELAGAVSPTLEWAAPIVTGAVSGVPIEHLSFVATWPPSA
mgnify:CR=1 FL=1